MYPKVDIVMYVLTIAVILVQICYSAPIAEIKPPVKLHQGAQKSLKPFMVRLAINAANDAKDSSKKCIVFIEKIAELTGERLSTDETEAKKRSIEMLNSVGALILDSKQEDIFKNHSFVYLCVDELEAGLNIKGQGLKKEDVKDLQVIKAYLATREIQDEEEQCLRMGADILKNAASGQVVDPHDPKSFDEILKALEAAQKIVDDHGLKKTTKSGVANQVNKCINEVQAVRSASRTSSEAGDVGSVSELDLDSVDRDSLLGQLEKIREDLKDLNKKRSSDSEELKVIHKLVRSLSAEME